VTLLSRDSELCISVFTPTLHRRGEHAGKFTGFQASVDVTANEDFSIWYWNGTHSFSPND
jgi:hypothetical protein